VLTILQGMLAGPPPTPAVDDVITEVYAGALGARAPLDEWPPRCPWNLGGLIAATKAAAIRLQPSLAHRIIRSSAVRAPRDTISELLEPHAVEIDPHQS
jgi:hypothetical protein